MSGKIFINYRRGDDPGNTGRLFDRLQEVFAPEQLFMDVDSIAPGLDFVRVLEEQVGQCDALLAVIGKGWIDNRDDKGARRLDNPDDFVRIEIESALKQDKRVIPVLVGDTQMPRPEELPEAIRPLARRNAERFRADAQGLIKALQRALEEVEALRQANAEVARRAQAEEERKREEAAANARAQAQREAEEQARRDKEQARLNAIAGLSSDQITKAEELANWDFIKASESAQEYRDHLARFPGGVTERFARARLEDLAWAGLGATPGLDQLCDFLAEFPQGRHAKSAADRRAALEERRRKTGTYSLAVTNAIDEQRRREQAQTKREAQAEKRQQDEERRKLEKKAAWAAKKERLHRWRGPAAAGTAVVALLIVGGIWLHNTPTRVAVTSTADPPRVADNKAAADAEAKRKAEEGAQQQLAAAKEEEEKAKAAAEAEAKRKAEEVEQQRIAAAKEEEEKAKAAAEAEAKRKAEEVEQQRLAAVKAEEERKAKAAADAEAKPPDTPVGHKTLGLEVANMSNDLRQRYKLKDTLKGVVITGIVPSSPAAGKRLSPGDVIIEIGMEAVANADDVQAKIDKLRKENRRSALLLVASGDGEMRFVPLGLR
jgi:hypothetical protein